MELFDRSLTNIPIELHTKYLSNFHNKYISDPDQFVWSGYWGLPVYDDSLWILGKIVDPLWNWPHKLPYCFILTVEPGPVFIMCSPLPAACCSFVTHVTADPQSPFTTFFNGFFVVLQLQYLDTFLRFYFLGSKNITALAGKKIEDFETHFFI
jgi:hypothetical protein